MSKDTKFDMDVDDIAWCPGCGNFALHRILKSALDELELNPREVVLVSGIGQAAKLPQYTKGNMFNGLHGRALPVAMAIKATNPNLKVIVDSGDGCTYGEGGNHFTAQILRNSDITVIAHNNMIYGLTKGQASPTSLKGFKTPVQVNGVDNEPFNPLSAAISQNISFASRIFVGDFEKSKDIIKQAIKNKGFSLVDAFCPCVTFNKFNTYKWYKENTYYLEAEYTPNNREQAFERAIESEKYPLGIFYINNERPAFWETTAAYKESKDPLFKRDLDLMRLKKLIESKRI
ncbi:MAG: 2-oxoacid ferredoxin oxidoreductase [Candidatus Lokiarchaeota archaeon]|nr:2-oxoacid ferredoxin oxidoreductase [Candidatus Lokiarchaeota archaeon]